MEIMSAHDPKNWKPFSKVDYYKNHLYISAIRHRFDRCKQSLDERILFNMTQARPMLPSGSSVLYNNQTFKSSTGRVQSGTSPSEMPTGFAYRMVSVKAPPIPYTLNLDHQSLLQRIRSFWKDSVGTWSGVCRFWRRFVGK